MMARPRALSHGLAVGVAVAAIATVIAALTFRGGAGVPARILVPTGAGQGGALLGAADQKDQGLIVFASKLHGRFHLHLINPDGSGERVLTSGRGEEFSPAWSPDRELVAFAASPRAGDQRPAADIYVVRTDGTGLSRVTSGSENDEDPTWSPDGTHIAFTASDRSTGRTRIRIASLDGSTVAPLPEPPMGCLDREPAWSPDGVTIAFARQCQGGSSRLFLIHVDGTGLLRMAGFGRTPAWSPDGSKLAYTGWGRYAPAIYVVNSDGSGTVQLTTDGTGDPTWSPDGSRIVFTLGALALRLFVIDVDGHNERPLTRGTSDQVTPAW
jgi:Tol biopolymer transport system component